MANHDEDLQDFLTKVEDVSRTIDRIVRGEASATECDEAEERLLARSRSRSDPDQAVQVKYRNGPGKSDQYQVFCKRCHIEHDDAVENCVQCGESYGLESRQTRQIHLKQQIAKLVEQREQHKQRKGRWARYCQYRKDKMRLSGSFEKWDVWEPDSDSDDEPIPDSNDPRFAALEADMKQRDEALATKRKQADAFKNEGNDCFTNGQYIQASELYTKAIELKKDCPAYYTNRALSYIHNSQFSLALNDCDAVLDMAEFFQGNRFPKNDRLVMKAWVRRSLALRGLLRFDDAIDSLVDGALKCRPGDQESILLIGRCRQDQQQYRDEIKARKEGGDHDLRSIINKLKIRSARDPVGDLCEDLLKMMKFGDNTTHLLFTSLDGLNLSVSLLDEYPSQSCQVLSEICQDNTSNLTAIAKPSVVAILLGKLDPRFNNLDDIVWSTKLLTDLTTLQSARKYLLGTNARKVAKLIWGNVEQSGNCDLRSASVGLMANCSLSETFRAIFRRNHDQVFAPYHLTVIISSRTASDEEKQCCLSALSNLFMDHQIRGDFAGIQNPNTFTVLVGMIKILWKRCLKRDEGYGEQGLRKCLGAVLNLSLSNDGLVKVCGAGLVPIITTIMIKGTGDIRYRALQLIARSAKLDTNQGYIMKESFPFFYAALVDEDAPEHEFSQITRILASLSPNPAFVSLFYACHSPVNIRQLLVRSISRSSSLNDVQALGNICLCISKCIDNDDQTGHILGQYSNIIPALVSTLRNTSIDAAVRKNAAIVAAKLSKCSHNYSQLKELRAMEIMLCTANELVGKKKICQ